MVNVCPECGIYRADKIVDMKKSVIICPECGGQIPFIFSPLFIISGASGSGKSTVCNNFVGKIDEVIVLDCDILWQEEFNCPENNFNKFNETWLRLSKNISQSGRPVVLFGAGIGIPENIESCIERRYFSNIFYLSLICSDGVLKNRLEERPQWRQSQNKEFIESQIKYNNWLKKYDSKTGQKIVLIDTTEKTIEETTQRIKRWIGENLK
jgi:adenylate kinase family enzyme